MRRAQGYAVWTDKISGKVTQEMDTFTCCHCTRIVPVPPKADPSTLGGFCTMCMKNICPACADKKVCEPFEKQMAKREARERLLKSIGV